MLLREIVGQDVRPEFPEAFPAGVRNLASLCWSPVAARRPTFKELHQLFSEATKAREEKERQTGREDRLRSPVLSVAVE